MHNFNT